MSSIIMEEKLPGIGFRLDSILTAVKVIDKLFEIAKTIDGPIGTIITEAAEFLKKLDARFIAIHPSIQSTLPFIMKVVKAIETVLIKIGLIDEDDSFLKMGARLIEGAKNPNLQQREDFESMGEYLAYLKKEIPNPEINPNEFTLENIANVMVGVVAFTNHTTKLVKESFMELFEEFLFGDADVKEIEITEKCIENEKFTTEEFSEYLKGNSEIEKSEKIRDVYLEEGKKLYPEAKEEDLLIDLVKLKEGNQVG